MLDQDLGSPEEVVASLVDLRHINNWFGGTRTTATLLRRIASTARSQKLSLLEAGSGAGDLPLEARRLLAGDGLELQVTLLDRMWSHLPNNGVPSISADALALPFRAEAFD